MIHRNESTVDWFTFKLRTIQLQHLQHYWLEHRLGFLWYWMLLLGNEQRSFCRFWDCTQILHFNQWISEYSQSILKEINPEYSLKGLMLKLKLQYFGHLMQRTDSLEKTLMLGKIEGRRRGWQRTRWSDGISYLMDKSLSKFLDLVMDREAWHAAVHRAAKSWTRLSIWTKLNYISDSFVDYEGYSISSSFFFNFFLLAGGKLLYNIVVGFVIHWNESAMDVHMSPIPIPPPTSFSTRSLWVFPVHQVQALVSCIQPGLVICFTLDNIYVSMLFSWNIPPLPSPTESTNLFYTSVSLFLFCI